MKTTIEDALTRQQIRDAEDFLMKNLSDIFFKTGKRWVKRAASPWPFTEELAAAPWPSTQVGLRF